MQRLLAFAVAAAAVIAAIVIVPSFMGQNSVRIGMAVPAGAPLPLAIEPEGDDPHELNPEPAPPAALAPPGGAIVQPGVIRIPKPQIDLNGKRKVGLQVGHWETTTVPTEYGTRILTQTGTSWAGHTEVGVTMEIAERTARLLRAQSIDVDILPTTVPIGYLADAFVSLHLDGDGVGELSGFKLAYSSRRGPYEAKLLQTIKDRYAMELGMSYDAEHVSRAMSGYYAHNWSRYQHATSPFTPSVILEMGFLSNADDRALMVNHPDRVAAAIANSILIFLDDTPRSKIFGADLLVPQSPLRRGQEASPSPSTRP